MAPGWAPTKWTGMEKKKINKDKESLENTRNSAKHDQTLDFWQIVKGEKKNQKYTNFTSEEALYVDAS